MRRGSFASGKKQRARTEEELTAPLYEEIGRLKMDIKRLRKEAMSLPRLVRRGLEEPDPRFSIRRQCRPAGVPRPGIYFEHVPEMPENFLLMRLIDKPYMRHPEFGGPRMTEWLRDERYDINHKRFARLMRCMVLQGDHAGPAHEETGAGPQDLPVFAEKGED